MKRFKTIDKNHWWITTHENPSDRAGVFIPLALARKDGDFSRVRGVVWAWFRRECGRTDLSVSAKLIMWAVCERWRYETWSSHDAISYYAKMTGLSSKTVGRCVSELVRADILWIAVEGEKRILKTAKPGVRKHLLFVGLGKLLVEELSRANDT